jgi:DNA adenine methylase
MYQQTLFDDNELTRVVNVASVPQRSPFRYPGGKTWLVPQIRRWLWSKKTKPAEFIEPFAGGGIVGLTVAAEKLAGHVTMVELDGEIAAVWRTILEGEGEWLAERILNFRLSREGLEKELHKDPRSTREKAFQTLLKNRTFHGGILAPGSRPIRNGENGRGILSRWYPETLAKRILNIATIRDRISFIDGDGIQVIRKAARDSDTVFFIDPPYTASGKKAGRRLYTCFDIDHEKLFREVSKVSGDFLMTYDDAPGVRELALKHGLDMALVAMKNTHHAKMSELLIGRKLDWARSRKDLM